MLCIAVCDDKPSELEKVSRLTKEYIASREMEAQVAEFSHPDALLGACQKTSFALFLLDVIMPMISGIDVGRELRRQHSRAPIIYLTSSDEFAVEAFAVQASNYLLKPLDETAFYAAMDRAFHQIKTSAPRHFSVRLEGGILCDLELDEVLYIESKDHQQYVHCKTGVYIEERRSLARLQEELELLAPGQFVMPYKGYLVNLQVVHRLDSDHIVLKGSETIPLAQRSFRQVRKAYLDYYFQEV